MTLNSEEEEEKNPTCHQCDSLKYCVIGRVNKKKDDCPMIISPEIEKEALKLYEKDKFIKKSTGVASIVEAKGYIKWPRLKDTIEYAKGMGFNRLGLAFCVGLLAEAGQIAKILDDYRFEVVSVCCKTGSVPKTKVGVPEEYTMRSKTGYPIGIITCNPAAQALLLNKAKTDLNIIVGLCVGHDITFTHLSNAPVTTLIAKDRSSPHNPAACLLNHYGKSFFSMDLSEIKQKELEKQEEKK
ncbi:MAG: DUF1847 domain-containing protein [Candidatus Lokiarchaeota archaeon]|nr:DUF1847 domain-containing protein [Candidatus Lokiarchaeota archaeon]